MIDIILHVFSIEIEKPTWKRIVDYLLFSFVIAVVVAVCFLSWRYFDTKGDWESWREFHIKDKAALEQWLKDDSTKKAATGVLEENNKLIDSTIHTIEEP